MKIFFTFLLSVTSTMFLACRQIKTIHKGNTVYRYIDNQDSRDTDETIYDCIEVYYLHKSIKSNIKEETDFLLIEDDSKLKLLTPNQSFDVKPPIQGRVDLGGAFYTNENFSKKMIKAYDKSFTYNDIRFGLQALNVPLKFRNRVGDGILNPSTIETGVNLGFAPSVKFAKNVFNPDSKVMGKNLNQYSMTTGLLFNLGTTDLKKSSNASGILSDRKGATFTFGTFMMFGINNINFGYALGIDNLMGNKGAEWVYNGKVWHGVIVSLDVIKF